MCILKLCLTGVRSILPKLRLADTRPMLLELRLLGA